MKAIIKFLAALTLSLPLVAAALQFEVNNSQAEALIANPELSKGQFVAFRGSVAELRSAPERNTPYARISLSGGAGVEFWAASLFSLGRGNGIPVGSEVLVLGFLAPVEAGDPVEEINPSGLHLLTACIVNLTAKETYFMPQARKDCAAWENGNIGNLYRNGT